MEVGAYERIDRRNNRLGYQFVIALRLPKTIKLPAGNSEQKNEHYRLVKTDRLPLGIAEQLRGHRRILAGNITFKINAGVASASNYYPKSHPAVAGIPRLGYIHEALACRRLAERGATHVETHPSSNNARRQQLFAAGISSRLPIEEWISRLEAAATRPSASRRSPCR